MKLLRKTFPNTATGDPTPTRGNSSGVSKKRTYATRRAVSLPGFLGIIGIVGISLSACEDFLSQVPDNRTIIDSKEKVAELLVTAYPDGNYMMFCEAMSDNVE